MNIQTIQSPLSLFLAYSVTTSLFQILRNVYFLAIKIFDAFKTFSKIAVRSNLALSF